MQILKNYHVSNLFVGLLAVAVLAAVTFLLQSLIFERLNRSASLEDDPNEIATTTEDASLTEDGIPPFTDEIKAQLDASQGFQYLVSYTDRGFEPAELDIASGETVRFTNNSSAELRLVITNEQGQSLRPDDCDGSDDCRFIGVKGFWEITFDSPGEWSYANGVERGGAGVITIIAR